jgi:hypothetical protein
VVSRRILLRDVIVGIGVVKEGTAFASLGGEGAGAGAGAGGYVRLDTSSGKNVMPRSIGSGILGFPSSAHCSPFLLLEFRGCTVCGNIMGL